MKLDGVLILRISDLKRFFDFQSFWVSARTFIDAVAPNGQLDDFFFDKEEEKLWFSIFARAFMRFDEIWAKFAEDGTTVKIVSHNSTDDYGKYEYFAKDIVLSGKQQLIFYEELKSACESKYVLMEIFALYMMLGNVPDENVLHYLLGIIGEIKTDFGDRYIFVNNDQEVQNFRIGVDEMCPREIKTIHNISSGAIRIRVKDGDKILYTEKLGAGGCLNGVFRGERCERRIPEKNSSSTLKLVPNGHCGTDLQILRNGEILTEPDVISYFSDGVGYVFVRSDGSRSVSHLFDIDQFLNTYRFDSDESLIYVYKDDYDITQIMTNKN